MNIEQARTNMLTQQIRATHVVAENIINVLHDTPREEFVPEAYRDLAFADTSIDIGHGQILFRPFEESHMLNALNPQANERVLEIGTGSGYTTALFAKLAKQVASVDIFPEFCEAATSKLYDFDIHNADIQVGDAAAGWQSEQRFEVIAITAAYPELPASYKKQLTIGGRLFVILGEGPAAEACVLTHVAENEWQTKVLFETVVPMMLHSKQLSQFSF